MLLKHAISSYSNVETLNTAVGVSMLNTSLVSIGFILICISLFIKLSIAPFHYWSLDVYEESPSSSTFFFAVVPKLAIFVLLIRIFYSSFFEYVAK